MNFYLRFICILTALLAHTSWAIPGSHPKTTFGKNLSISTREPIEVWKRTLALSLSQIQATGGSSGTTNAMRSGPLAAVFRATLSTSSSTPCTATHPLNKCEVALNGFGTIGEVHYTFNNSDKNLQGRSTQAIVACRCLSRNCTHAVLVRPVAIMKHDAKGNLKESGKNTCLYQAVQDGFTDCHRELFRVSYRERGYDGTSAITLNESEDVDYSVADEHHGDWWSARGNRGSKLKCLESDINKLRRVNMSTASFVQSENVGNQSGYSPSSSCVPPAGSQFFRGDEQNEEELCGEVLDRALSAARHMASQQDCFGVGKRRMAFTEPASSTLISDTELALTCSSAVLGIMWLWSVLLKQLRMVKEPTRISVFAVGVQMGLSYILEALPLHTALSNEIKGRNWRSLIAFIDATSSEMVKETLVGKFLVMTIVLGEAEYLSTRVGLVAALTGVFDFIALVLGISIVYGMVRRYRKTRQGNRSKKVLQESNKSVARIIQQSQPWRSSIQEAKQNSISETSSELSV